MTILNRYIIRELIRIFILTLSTLLSIFIIITMFEQLGRVLHYDAKITDFLKYLLMKIPEALYFMTPVSILLSTILCVSILSKSSEIVSMMSCGIGIVSIVWPIILVSIFGSVISFMNGEYLLPYTNRERTRILDEKIRKLKVKGVYKKNNLWYRSDNGSIWKVGLLGDEGHSLRNVSIFDFDANNGITRRISSSKVNWVNNHWEFYNCQMWTFNSDGSFNSGYFTKKTVEYKEKPEDFITIKKPPDEMNYSEIKEYIKKIKKDGLDSKKYEVDMNGKLSFPFLCIIMALFGIPFSLKTGRQGGVTLGIAIGVVTSFFVWFTYSIGLAMGRADIIPVIVSAWGVIIIFLVSGSLMLYKTKL